MLAFNNFSAGNHEATHDCIANIQTLLAKPDLHDPEIAEATAELAAKLAEIAPAPKDSMEQGPAGPAAASGAASGVPEKAENDEDSFEDMEDNT